MKQKINNFINALFAVLVIISPIIILLAISWAAVVLVCIGISYCFGFEITILQATGVWLIIALLRSIFKVTVKKEK